MKKYKINLFDEKGQKYTTNFAWIKAQLGLDELRREYNTKIQRLSYQIAALERILALTIIEHYEKEIYEIIRRRTKKFRLDWITESLSNHTLFNIEKWKAIDKMIESGEILKCSYGWFQANPDLIYINLKEASRIE